jgi:mono/diheme cytochrome c family protein
MRAGLNVRQGLLFTALFLMSAFYISCAGGSGSDTQLSNEQDLLQYGKKIYESQCMPCHGEKGSGRFAGAKDLNKTQLSETEIGDLVYHGRKGMPAFRDRLGEPEILAVSKYALTLKND